MQRIDEAELEENGWHGGALKYVKLLGFPDAAEVVSLKSATYTFDDVLRNSEGFFGPFEDPGLHTDSLDTSGTLFFWHRVQMDGQEYGAVVAIRDRTPFSESNVLIHTSGESYGGLVVEEGLQLKHEVEGGVLLPEGIPCGSWISSAMARIQTDSDL